MTPDATIAAALLAVDPAGLGGIWWRGRDPQAATELSDAVTRCLPAGAPSRRVPAGIDDGALLGGLDLGETLRAGRPVQRAGLLRQAAGGVLALPSAERASPALAARLAAVLDAGEDGTAVLAFDAGLEDERLPAALSERLAFHLADTQPGPAGQADAVEAFSAQEVAQARALLRRVRVPDAALQSLCATAFALGIDTPRASLLALRAARAAAALAGADEAQAEHLSWAARLVLAPRATRLPPPPDAADGSDVSPPDASDVPDAPADPAHPAAAASAAADEAVEDPARAAQDTPLDDVVLAAAQAAIPAGLLARLQAGLAPRGSGPAGQSGTQRQGASRGRPVGTRRGAPRRGERLQVVDTLRAAAPWQPLRRRDWARRAPSGAPAPRVHVRPQDFHVQRLQQASPTTTLFLVDASGSTALNRLAEAKGAVELLLADCYVRRDKVCLLAFRGNAAELLLPPTRSLARAKRSLAGLAGGGGTPLAHGLDAARELAQQLRRRGDTPLLVLLTDGRANIARDGTPGRERAHQDALAAARLWCADGSRALLLDTAPQPQPTARALAQAMDATYVPLPHAGAQAVSQVVRLAASSR